VNELGEGARPTSATEGMLELDCGMSNFDHSIDDGFESALRAEPSKVFGRHAGWNFNAKVWFDGSAFCSEVWVYHSIAGTRKAETLRELMDLHNEEWGGE